jgi:oxygen-independent coproporphyrinogen-3 oxidase
MGPDPGKWDDAAVDASERGSPEPGAERKASRRGAGTEGVAGGIPAGERTSHEFGVYVHVPFCAHRCDYCDFATWTDRGHLVDEYVDACVADLGARTAAGDVPDATSVFFGGGTPSLLPAPQLARILAAIPRADGAEVTVECNPDSADGEQLIGLADAGVNRVSIGVQSMATHVLTALNRTHDPANVVRAVRSARGAGIRRLNLDLIYGTPGETLADWRATLDAALALGPDHVSAYALTVEPGTPLGRAVAAGTRPAPDDDDQADKYAAADDVLTAAGLDWYEISNWARPGEECRHNLLYWQGGDYLAIGCAAHGKRGARRWWNVRTPERYIDAVRAGASAEAGSEELDAGGRAAEMLGLALRTRAGAPSDRLDASAVAELVVAGLVTVGAGRLRLTRAGRLLANEVTIRLVG